MTHDLSASSSTMVRETAAVAATLCGTVPALAPLAMPGIAATHDGFLHVQRLIALEAGFRQGAPFTRWLPDLAYGYGQPLLLYYAPLAYLPALAARFLGVGFAGSIELASGLALVLSALAMYLFARSLFGPLAAAVSAIVYAVLPYQLVDVYVRGALAESWAFVWLPLCAWCLTRAWIDGRPRWSVGLALAVAGLVLTHNVTALLFLPPLVLLGLLFLIPWLNSNRQIPYRAMAALALGLALSAWFWLPALAERGLVQIGETIEPDLFKSFFVRAWPPFRLEPLFDYERPVSTALGPPIFWPQLGIVQVVVTVVGAIVAIRTSGVRRVVAIWATLLAIGGYLMQLQPFAALYDRLPLLSFVQFPWRLLAIVGLGSALLAGVIVEAVSCRSTIRGAFAVTIVGASLVTALARLSPEMTPVDDSALSSESIARIELADYGLGTTHSGEYLPVSSGQRNATRLRKTLLEAGGSSTSARSTSTGLQIEHVAWRPDRIQIRLNTPTLERLTLHQFSFPGWAAWIDGSPTTASTVGQLGLIGIDVSAGAHTVEVAWTWTPLRAGAATLSVAALLALMPLASPGRWRPTPRTALVALATVGLIAELLAPTWTSSNLEEPSTAESSRVQVVGDALALASATLDRSRAETERLVVSRLVWLVRTEPTAGYRAFVEVTAADGQVVHRAPWVYEPLTRLWARGELVSTTIAVRIPVSVAAGTYDLRLVFDRPDALQPVPLGAIQVALPASGSSRSILANQVTIGSDLRLSAPDALGGPNGPKSVRRGTSVDVPLRWEQRGETPNVDREILVMAVLGAPGGDIISEPRRPGDWFSPLPFWQQGDIVDQTVRLSLPARLPSGTFPLSVRVYARDLARSGAAEPGASSDRPRGRPIAELPLGNLTVTP